MVEGPGCKLKGIKLKKRAKGQKVNDVSGDVIAKKTCLEKLIGLTLLDVKTLGKELFALFENDVCLRIHFLMSGSVRYNNEPKEFGSGNTAEARLKLHMTKDEIGFFDSGVELRSCAECIEKHDMLIDLDICSPTFDAKRACRTIREHPDRLICDVILDQLVLPGVGNIIKNEALYDAGINPLSKVNQLSEDLISHLVKMNRDFTNIFYKCRKEGKDLRKHMRVYKKTSCPECGGKITKCKIGEYERVTFFCQSCQTNTIRTVKKLAMRNSLLGWVQAAKDQVPWNCSLCTLENKAANTKCSACFTSKGQPTYGGASSRPHEFVASSVEILSREPDGNSSQGESHLTGLLSPVMSSLPSTFTQADMSTSISSGSSLKRHLENTPGSSCQVGKYTFKRMSAVGVQNSNSLPGQNAHSSPLSDYGIEDSCTKTAILNRSHFRGKIQPKRILNDVVHKNEEIVLCTGHKKAAKKFVVEKKTENRGRTFYVCNMPQNRQCNFFQWADDHHPLCCHGKISVLRTVMKMNANNGREFYCCPLPKGKQCDFFEWVDKKT